MTHGVFWYCKSGITMALKKRTYSLPAVTLERFEHAVPLGRRSGVIANMLQEWIDRRRREQLRREVIEGCRDMSAVYLEIEQAFHPLEEELYGRA
jgi:metal-responsive CopG/Arc/MetJ family transcriptional regulator